MRISICGSMHHKLEMLAAQKTLEALGYDIETPDMSEKSDYSILPAEQRAAIKDGLIRRHLDNITMSDAILVFNKEKNGVAGYVGGNTLMEMAFAYAQGIEIFMLEPTPDVSYADEIDGMRPIVLNGELTAIDAYFKGLPKTFVSSISPVKLTAVSRSLRRASIRTQVLSMPTNSDVSAQPASIDETYEGAQNRHAALQKAAADQQAAYLVTVESGLHTIHPNHNVFGCTVVVLEKVGYDPKTGMNVEIEYPKAMTDKVPSVYPDLGTLVQQEYGAVLKDPIPYFTGGKIKRQQFVENAVFNVAVQLEEN